MVWRLRIRAFLDSNVWYSGVHSPNGAPGMVIAQYVEGEFQAVVSKLVLEEMVAAVGAKMPSSLGALQDLMTQHPPEVCPDPSPDDVAQCRQVIHLEDAPILAAAIAAQVDYLVTGDKHFLSKADALKEEGVVVVSPAEFLGLV